ncbi:PLDc N-terminal domain-containing protein [Aureisphaera galaxeae]|uniref:PLDc N-terminal domain-containing protein n=1 Tax=Aureisphaera galaxeae TaxID=1538023 RepID=UPI002350BC6C|nr:PLDc N-terminal domain-containing protein [Aureisphaera galaxeae]MDC8004646.1 PLDc N-terminal domain-containing protein [Aureisphaera galaxeae]
MFRFIPVVAILQVYCLYHAYKNRADQKWFWFIIFFPIIGGIFYLYDHFYNRENLESISEGFKGIVNSNYEIEKLEKQLEMTDSDLNRTNLADHYMEAGRYRDAIKLYTSCVGSKPEQQSHIIIPLVFAHYYCGEYSQSVLYAEKIKDLKEFKKAPEKAGYAWSLYHMGERRKAEEVFLEMDSMYSNYPQRLEYAKFLNEIGSTSESLKYLQKLLSEFTKMQPQERRDKRLIHKAIKSYKDKLSKGKVVEGATMVL